MLRDGYNSSEESKALVHFFEDVARLPVISHRHQYIPLIRRIQRGVLLKKLKGTSEAATLRQIQSELQSTQKMIRDHDRNGNLPLLDFYSLATEIESFLDDPDQSAPPTVAHYLGPKPSEDEEQYRDREELAWRLFYLLSLLPLSLRDKPTTNQLSQRVTEHFCQIAAEFSQAQRTLTEGMIRYPIKIARHYLQDNVSFLDLVQEGCFGLLRATETYNERLGTLFQHHATQWIRQRIMRYIAEASRMIRLPVHAHEEVREIDRRYQAQVGKREYLSKLEYAIAEGWITDEQVAIVRQENRRIRLLERVDRYQHFASLMSVDPEELDVSERQPVALLRNAKERLQTAIGGAPSSLKLFVAVDWMTIEEVCFFELVQSIAYKERAKKAFIAWHKVQKRLNLYDLGQQVHFSLERTDLSGQNCHCNSLINCLVAGVDSVNMPEFQLATDALDNVMMSALTEHQHSVLALRFGLRGSSEYTLEEIGEKDGVTRERIRQIEATAIRRLKYLAQARNLKAFLEPDNQLTESIIASQMRRLEYTLSQIEGTETLVGEFHEDYEIEFIDQLIDRYVPKGRRQVYNTRVRRGRVELFRQILHEVGQPLHFMELHERGVKRVPADLSFSPRAAYSTLFYDEHFRAFGQGRFGLIEWKDISEHATPEQVLLSCPQPLLASSGEPRSFFESIMIGRALLRQKPELSVRQFYLEMLGWAGRTTENVSEAQAAFDAWYAAGLFDRIDYLQDANRQLVVKIEPDAKLNEVRIYCLNVICQRILKMPELLLTLEQIAHPTVSEIRKVLFGADNAGPDVEVRLTLLAAFDAVRRDGNSWALGSPGKAALEVNPPQDLPDFGEIVTVVEPEDMSAEIDWEDGLDLFSD